MIEEAEFCQHEWQDEYYGYRCSKCKMFYPYGCAPWEDDTEVDESWNDGEIVWDEEE